MNLIETKDIFLMNSQFVKNWFWLSIVAKKKSCFLNSSFVKFLCNFLLHVCVLLDNLLEKDKLFIKRIQAKIWIHHTIWFVLVFNKFKLLFHRSNIFFKFCQYLLFFILKNRKTFWLSTFNIILVLTLQTVNATRRL